MSVISTFNKKSIIELTKFNLKKSIKRIFVSINNTNSYIIKESKECIKIGESKIRFISIYSKILLQKNNHSTVIYLEFENSIDTGVFIDYFFQVMKSKVTKTYVDFYKAPYNCNIGCLIKIFNKKPNYSYGISLGTGNKKQKSNFLITFS